MENKKMGKCYKKWTDKFATKQKIFMRKTEASRYAIQSTWHCGDFLAY